MRLAKDVLRRRDQISHLLRRRASHAVAREHLVDLQAAGAGKEGKEGKEGK